MKYNTKFLTSDMHTCSACGCPPWVHAI